MSEVVEIMWEIKKFPWGSGVIELYKQWRYEEVKILVELWENLEERLIPLRDNYLTETDVTAQVSFTKRYFTLDYKNNDIIFIFHLSNSEEECNKLLWLFHYSYNYKQLIRQFSKDLEENISFENLKKLMFWGE